MSVFRSLLFESPPDVLQQVPQGEVYPGIVRGQQQRAHPDHRPAPFSCLLLARSHLGSREEEEAEPSFQVTVMMMGR